MRLKLSHRTRYDYDRPVPYALQQLRLKPKSSAGQSVLDWTLKIEGAQVEGAFTDQHNNQVDLLRFDTDCRTVSIACEGEVETVAADGVIGAHGGYAPLWYFKRSTDHTRAGPNVRKLVKALGAEFDSDIARLHALSGLILSTVAYEIGQTQMTTLAEQALEEGRGVCQDHAHIFVSAARLMGFPARYVSGYLFMDDRTDQEAGHAWAEAHMDGLGWVGFDISNGISPDERYIRVATGLDYSEAAPVSGITFGGAQETMSVALTVEAVD